MTCLGSALSDALRRPSLQTLALLLGAVLFFGAANLLIRRRFLGKNRNADSPAPNPSDTQ